MRPLRALVIYLVGVFLGGALLAPWLYWLVQTVAPSFPLVAHAPFHRFMDRSLLILALAGLWPLLRALGTTSGRDIGLLPPRGQWKKFWGGLLLGSLTLGVAAGTAIGSGDRILAPNLTAHKIFGTIFNAIANTGGAAGEDDEIEEIEPPAELIVDDFIIPIGQRKGQKLAEQQLNVIQWYAEQMTTGGDVQKQALKKAAQAIIAVKSNGHKPQSTAA